VVALLGLENQNLPVLVLGDEAEPPPQAKVHDGHCFISACPDIAQWLAQRHGYFHL
jgi:hypothetical protein